jgi:bifunctional non-homologous end joining protein LigD
VRQVSADDRVKHWTQKYPAIANAIAGLRARDAYLDGELCGVLPDGKTAFNLIQNATDAGQGSLVFFVFDLLFLDGEDIRDLPLVDCKARLEAFLVGAPESLPVQRPPDRQWPRPYIGWRENTASKASS